MVPLMTKSESEKGNEQSVKQKKVLQQTQEIKSPKFVKNTYILICNFSDICIHSEIIGITIWWQIGRKKSADGDFLKEIL